MMFRSILIPRQTISAAVAFQKAVARNSMMATANVENIRCFSVLIHTANNSKTAFGKSQLNPHAQQLQQQRYYTPMTKEEEEAEKERVASLSDFKREQELRKLNREIMKLNMLKGINTGELYTVRGRYKMLLADYGLPMMAWYAAVWMSSGVLVFGALTVGGLDAMAVLAKADAYTGLDWSSRVDPALGMLGITVVLNEMLEPVRLPFVVFTVKPVMDRFFPPKV